MSIAVEDILEKSSDAFRHRQTIATVDDSRFEDVWYASLIDDEDDAVGRVYRKNVDTSLYGEYPANRSFLNKFSMEISSIIEEWATLLLVKKSSTSLGRKLGETRKRIVASGVPLLTLEEVNREAASRRGELGNEG